MIFILFSLVLVPIVHASFIDDILIWLGLKEMPQEIIRTASTDTYIAPDGTTTLIIGSTNYLDRATGKYEPYDWNKETKFYSDDNSLYIEWLDKKVVLDFYILDKNNNTIFLKDLSTEEKANLNLKTFISKLNNEYVYNHSTTKNVLYLPNGIGYKITTINTECNPNGNTLICDEQILSFAETVEKQNLNVNIKSNDIKILPKNYSIKDINNKTLSYISDVSFIDPDLTVSTAITMCGLNDTYDNIIIQTGGIIRICDHDGTAATGRLILKVANLTININGTIDGSGAGFRGSTTQDVNPEGCGAGQSGAGGGSGGGAGYGGKGGNSSAGYAVGGIACGSATNVTDMGYGGGPSSSDSQSSDGGGYLDVNATYMIYINGSINMTGLNGIEGASWGYGAGSAGGVSLFTNKLYGNGLVNLSGGVGVAGSSGSGGGGGGGRGYIRYCDNSGSSIIYQVLGGASKNGGYAGDSGSINQALNSVGCDTAAPIIIFSKPANKSILKSNPVTFEVNLTDDNNLQNVSIIGNWTGGWNINETNIINGTTNTSVFNIRLLNGNYTYGYYACDSSRNCGYSSFNNSFKINEDLTPPIITPSQPTDAGIFNYIPIRFEANTTDETSLENISLIANWTTPAWAINETMSLTGQTTNTTNWDIRLANGNYTYNFVVCDTAGNCAIVPYNRTLKVNRDLVLPDVTLINPADLNLSAQSINYFNCSATDNINLSTIQLYSNFTGTWGLNKTNVTTGLANSITFPVNISDGLYKWTCKANDTSNNINWANENRSIEVDTHAPNFNISYPLTNDLWFSSASININITYGYDRNLANCNYSMGTDNGAFTCGNNISLIGLTDGQHNLSISISDTLGHYNNSLRSFYTDTNAPVPTAIEPVNDSKSLTTNINFNCSATEENNLDSIMTYGNWSGWGLKLLNHTSGTINSTYNNISTYAFSMESYFRWYCCANDTAGNIGCTGNSTINIDTTNPALTITTMPLNNMTFNDTSLIINFTIFDGHLETCMRSLDGQPNVTISCFNNITDLSGLSEGNHTIQVYGNDSFSRNSTVIREFLINTIQSIIPSYVNPAFEYDTIYFTLNITAPSITSFNGTFTYNNTLYYPTVIYNSTRGTLISQINVTDLNVDVSTRYFWWNFSLNGYNKYNASTYSHVVKKIPALYTNISCISDLQRAMCWDFKEENNLTQTNADEINYNFQYGILNTTHTKNYGTLTNISSFCLCINSTVYNNYTMGYGEIKYKKSGYTDRSFYTFTTQRLTNNTINNTLYFLSSGTATSFLFEMLDTSLNPFPNDYLSLMRWYPSNNSYNIVEMAKTDDKGQSVMRVRAEDTDYRVALYYPNGTIIKLLNPIRFACLASPCTYSVQIQETPLDYTSIYGVETSLTFNKTTNIWLFTWNDPTQRTDQMEFKVSKETALSSTLICDNNGTGFTGVLNCNSTGINGTLRAIAYRTASPKETISQLWQNVVGAVVTVQNAFKGTMGLLFTLLICITLFFIGASSPILAVILGAVSLVFGLFTLSISLNVLIGIAVLGGIVVHFISRTSS